VNSTQPICLDCFQARYPNRKPFAMRECRPEKCCDCGATFTDGIYFRIDPRTVKFPSEEE
jgi:hypothetical protein